ncbi:hypothetical protein ACQP2U_00890 [Nocardia sp. CA-084685]|uniref:hypothetical protein n=1 Tax=Nocardia sp. CA-084685 TaxID=3239970 RepID=UPI003D96A14D
MMQADLAATRDEDEIAAKRVVRDEAVARLCTELSSAESSTAKIPLALRISCLAVENARAVQVRHQSTEGWDELERMLAAD